MIETPLKILIIRFSSIGDIVLTTPVIRCLRKTYPDAKIHYLTKSSFKNIISKNPYIDKFHLYKGNLKNTIGELRDEKFDYVIDLHHNLRTWFVKRGLGVTSYSFRKLNYEKWLLVHFKINRLPPIHIVDRYIETLAPLNVVNDNQGLDFFLSAVDEVDIAKLPAPFTNGYVAIVLSGTFYTKRLPNDKVISLCQKIDRPIILLGGNAEIGNASKIMKKMGMTKVFNAVNKYGISQTASLLKQAEAVITNDTGMMHIAAAFNKRIISIWGNTVPEFGMTPYFGNDAMKEKNSVIIQVNGLSCRPCSKLGFNQCPKKHFKCMNDIDEDAIIEAIEVKNEE
jgi:ADP-heptose:LPS heptosyltransferase